jgi:hypothetical protein
VFNADEEFLAALPSGDRVGFSSHYAGRVVGPDTDPLLTAALGEAAQLDPRISLVTGVMDVLRSTEPAERSETHRIWSARSLAAPAGASADSWWIRADLVRSAQGADILWTLEGAEGPDGPWTTVGVGRHDPTGVGEFTWNLAATDALVGRDFGDVLEVDYEDPSADLGVRSATMRLPAAFGGGQEFLLVGDEHFAWTGDFVVVPDGSEEPGGARIALSMDGSGRGEGEVVRDGAPQAFASCWGPAGERVWSDGGDGLPAVGDVGACSLPADF